MYHVLSSPTMVNIEILGAKRMTCSIKYSPRKDDHGASDNCGVIHVLRRHRQHGRDRENDGDEACPGDAGDIRGPSEETWAHVEWSRLEVDLRVVAIESPPAPDHLSASWNRKKITI